MKNIFLQTYLIFFSLLSLSAQTGTQLDPFNTLHQATIVEIPGIYYFNINGVTFNTHVIIGGYVLIAIDFGDGVGFLPQSSSVSLASRGILSPNVLETFTNLEAVKITNQNNLLDIKSDNPELLAKIQSNTTLHVGEADNENNDSWQGTKPEIVTASATCNSIHGSFLHQNIIHGCGNTYMLHWIPGVHMQRLRHRDGEISDSESIRLWVKGRSALPIDLISFDANIFSDNNVLLRWSTAREINNESFSIQKSKDGQYWTEIERVDGAGNSNSTITYQIIDNKPQPGKNYYRIMQIDFSGDYSFSNIQQVHLEDYKNNIHFYPNPTNANVTVQGLNLRTQDFIILNALGQNVTNITTFSITTDQKIQIDLSQLQSGTYFIKSRDSISKLNKL